MTMVGSRNSATSALLHRSLFVLLLILVNYAGLSYAFDQQNCRNSCGKVNISYPLRLQGDPPKCGVARYELVCEGSEDPSLYLYLKHHKYLVTGVSRYEIATVYIVLNFTIVVDCPFTTSTCRVQGKSSFLKFPFPEQPYSVSFMNCSQRIENETYMLVPTLSGVTTTVYMIVGDHADELINLHESCRFLDIFLFENSNERWRSSKQVIDRLHKGFQLYYLLPYDIENTSQPTYALTVVRSALRLMLGGLYVVAVLCRFVFAPLCVCMFILYNCRKNTKNVDIIEKFLQKQQVLTPRRFTYGEIVAMTRHFKEKLGKGGFGSVYKGELVVGNYVAVKVLDGLKFNGEDFINEVATIGRIHHVNIVQLLGFCSEGNKRALIYEYMPNGSLEKYLFSSEENSQCPLNEDELNSIALGIARGLHYLHTGCYMQILHFDIKPHNILLDSDFTPKLSDFGLARLFPKNNNLVSISAARGTIGYIAPEVISRSFGVISYKSDVYSFGMLLLEIAGRRRNVDTRVKNSSQIYYPSWIYDNLNRLEVPNFDGIIEVGELEKKLCKIGLWCIQINSSKRPSMGEVVELLQANVDDIEMPPKPFFSSTEAFTIMPSSSIELSVFT